MAGEMNNPIVLQGRVFNPLFAGLPAEEDVPRSFAEEAGDRLDLLSALFQGNQLKTFALIDGLHQAGGVYFFPSERAPQPRIFRVRQSQQLPWRGASSPSLLQKHPRRAEAGVENR